MGFAPPAPDSGRQALKQLGVVQESTVLPILAVPSVGLTPSAIRWADYGAFQARVAIGLFYETLGKKWTGSGYLSHHCPRVVTG